VYQSKEVITYINYKTEISFKNISKVQKVLHWVYTFAAFTDIQTYAY